MGIIPGRQPRFGSQRGENATDSLSSLDAASGDALRTGPGRSADAFAASWRDAVEDAHASVQVAQLAVPGAPPLPLPPSALPQGLPPDAEQAIGEGVARAGRRLEQIGSEIGRGDLSSAAGHALLGQPFPEAVDAPPLAMSSQNQATTDSQGRPISQRAITLNAPGDCEPGRWRDLQDRVDAACKTTPLRCTSALSQPEVQSRVEQNMACGTARNHINSECFAGGDYEHRRQAYDAWKRTADCQEFLR